MIEIAYYMKNENDKELYWVDIINTNTKNIIASCGFDTVEDAFDYAREYEEDILCTDLPEEVWEYKLEMTRLCYEINKNQDSMEAYKTALLNLELNIVESILGKTDFEKVVDEVITNELNSNEYEEVTHLDEIKSSKDI